MEFKNNILNLIPHSAPVGGGCISSSFQVFLEDTKYFVKTNPFSKDCFIKEKEGLEELRKSNSIRVPIVFLADEDLLVLEWLETRKASSLDQLNLGREVAHLHQFQQQEYGFISDNYIGSSPQLNIKGSDWAKWFLEKRILFQVKLAQDQGVSTLELEKMVDRLGQKISSILPKDSKASLIHGDLWSGNYLIDENGKPCLFDPACYYGDREAEFGIITLFGGFSSSFFEGYDQVLPLEKDYKSRLGVYQLYHLLNHHNLFGGGYLSQAMSVLKTYV